MRLFILGILATALMIGCAHKVLSPGGGGETGLASFYASSMRGHKTASGERYNPKLFTAAHRTLAFGTRVEVRNLTNGRRVDVRINDRGPFFNDRIIDLSRAAAKELGVIQAGVAKVEIRVIPPSTSPVD